MQRICIVYDCPEECCDKMWLYEKTQSAYPATNAVYSEKRLSDFTIEGGGINRFKRVYYMLKTLYRCIQQISQTDTFIFWYKGHAVLFNLYCQLCGHKVNIISFNWLTPPKKNRYTSFILRKALSNPLFLIVCNDKNAPQLYKKAFSLSNTKNFYYFPDLYDTKLPFEQHNTTPFTSDYFFTGGMNNRDFGLILKLAQQNPQHRFILVSLKENWHFRSEEIPSNVTIYFNTSQVKYYDLMSKAKAVLLPLLDTRVAGLINIARSIQAGVICVSSKTPSTEIYYDTQSQKYLVEIGKLTNLQDTVNTIANYTSDQYYSEINRMQQYLKNNFAPDRPMRGLLHFAENYF